MRALYCISRVIVLIGLLLCGCTCVPDEVPSTLRKCQQSSDCPAPKRVKGCLVTYACLNRKCIARASTCKTDGDCPGGMGCLCGKCVIKRCQSEKDCHDPYKPRCDSALRICKSRRTGDLCSYQQECPRGTRCCRDETKEKRCNLPKCFRDSDCRPNDSNSEGCIEPVHCQASAQAFCERGVCQCHQIEFPDVGEESVESLSEQVEED